MAISIGTMEIKLIQNKKQQQKFDAELFRLFRFILFGFGKFLASVVFSVDLLVAN